MFPIFKSRTLSIAATTVALFGLWLILSDKRDVLHLSTGAVGAAGVAFSLARGRASVFAETNPRPLRFLAYLPWLLWQVLLSNFHVAKLVLSRRPSINPRFLHVTPSLKDPRALTLLGASITLTPGTLTVDVSPEKIIVHALDDAVAADVEARTIERRIAPLFDQGST